MSETVPDQPVSRVEAPASNDPVVRRVIVAVVLLGMAVWTFYDQYIMHKYPYGTEINVLAPYLMNQYAVYVLTPIGLAFLYSGLSHKRRKIVADEAGIGFAGKPQIAWGDIERIDAALLASKGYLTLHYGQGAKLKLDSYAFKNFREVVTFIERHVPAEKITR